MDTKFFYQVILILTIGAQVLIILNRLDAVEDEIKQTIKIECSKKG